VKCGHCAERFPDRPATRLGEITVYAGWGDRWGFKSVDRRSKRKAAVPDGDFGTFGVIVEASGEVHRSRLFPEDVARGVAHVTCRGCKKRLQVNMSKARSLVRAGQRVLYVWPNGRHATAA
jgi:hypothetical protein